MSKLETLQTFLDYHGIRFFSAKEVTLQRREGRYYVPEEGQLWWRILPTLKAADAIRLGLGAPIRLVSGIRSESYNDLVGGAPQSEHKECRAVDIQPMDPAKMEEMRKIAIAVVAALRSTGLNVALIHYDTFIHIDIGSKRRRNLDKDMR